MLDKRAAVLSINIHHYGNLPTSLHFYNLKWQTSFKSKMRKRGNKVLYGRPMEHLSILDQWVQPRLLNKIMEETDNSGIRASGLERSHSECGDTFPGNSDVQ